MAPDDNFSVELVEANGGELRVWSSTEARALDPGAKEISVDSDTATKWCEELRKLRVPAISANPFVTDIREYEVTVTDGSSTASYAWSGRAPRGWGRLCSVVESIVNFAMKVDRRS